MLTLAPSPVPSPEKSVGLIGLGLVGMALAQRLRAAGFEVTGFDISAQARATFAQSGFQVAQTAQQVAVATSRICLAVFDTQDVLKVLEGNSTQAKAHGTTPARVLNARSR